jgi:6-phosphogluconolactonase
MTTKVVPGNLLALATPDDVAREASSRIAKALRTTVRERGRATFALSGGETPRATYAALVAEDLPWDRIEILFVDERAVPPTSERSNHRLAMEALLGPARIPDVRVHRMRGEADDLDAAAREYEQVLRAQALAGSDGVPAIDVAVFGIGEDGHTASLFPSDPAVLERERLVMAVPPADGREARLTLTPPVIARVRTAFVLAVGAKKTPALERVWAVRGDPVETPARLLRECRGVLFWVIDTAAGGLA